MTDEDVLDGQFLAHVEFVKPETPNRYARLRPVYHISDQEWHRIEPGDVRFLDEGMVFWWHPPSQVVENTVWVVSLISHPKYGLEPRYKDRYQVSDAYQPYQAMALYGISGPREFRRVLASGNFLFDAPALGRPLIRVIGEVGEWIIIPDSFTSTNEGGHWAVTVHGLEGIVPVFTIDADSFSKVEVNGHRYSLILDPGIPTGYQCALSDAQLVEHLRKRISRVNRDVLKGLDVTKNILRQYVESIENAGLGEDDAAKESARGDAATIMLEGLNAEVLDIDETVAALMKHPRIAEDIEAKTKVERQRRREEFERELDKEDKAAIERLRKTKKELEVAKGELDELRESITSAVDDILEAPVEALVKYDLLDGLRRHLRTTMVHSPMMKIEGKKDEEIEEIDDLLRLREIALGWSAHSGIDPYMMQVTMASVLANRMTLISGANAEALSIALASILAGDNAVRVSVSTATFGISDLMNSPVTPVGHTSFTRACTLGEFLMYLNDEEASVIILTGCNRAPLEVVLPDLMQPSIDGNSLMGWRNDDNQIISVSVHERVSFIGTLHNGDATYKIPMELSRQLGFIPSERHEMDGLPLGKQVRPGIARISNALSDSLIEPTEAKDIDATVDWLRQQGTGLPPLVLTRILNTYVTLMGDDMRGTGEGVSSLMLGRGEMLDCTDLPGTQREELCAILNTMQEDPKWQECVSYFKTVDN